MSLACTGAADRRGVTVLILAWAPVATKLVQDRLHMQMSSFAQEKTSITSSCLPHFPVSIHASSAPVFTSVCMASKEHVYEPVVFVLRWYIKKALWQERGCQIWSQLPFPDRTAWSRKPRKLARKHTDLDSQPVSCTSARRKASTRATISWRARASCKRTREVRLTRDFQDAIATYPPIKHERKRVGLGTTVLHWKKDQDKGLEAPCREKPWRNPGSNLRHQIAQQIGSTALFQLSQIPIYFIVGDLVPQVRARTSPGFFTTWRFQAFVLNFLSIFEN